MFVCTSVYMCARVRAVCLLVGLISHKQIVSEQKETFMKRNTVESTNKAEMSEKGKSSLEN